MPGPGDNDPFYTWIFLTKRWIFWRNWFNVLTADGFLFHWGGVADKCAKWISRCDRKKNKLKKFIFPNFQHSLALIHPKWISPKNSNIFRKIFFMNLKRNIVVQIINRISNKQNLIQHVKTKFPISKPNGNFETLKQNFAFATFTAEEAVFCRLCHSDIFFILTTEPRCVDDKS